MSVSSPSKIALGLGLGLFLAACGGSDHQSDQPKTDTLAVDTTPKETELLNVGGRIFSIPSPVQTALAMRKAGLKYQKELTAPLENAEAAVNKTAQSTLLGILGADLAYATVHKDGQRAMATMQAIEKVGNKLELTNSFDRALLDRFKSNLGSEDSLLQFSGVAFRAADKYLKQNQRHDVSALVLAGGWIESLYLTVSDPAAAGDQTIVNRIGEQKNALNALVELVQASDADGGAEKVVVGLKELQSLFDKVTSTYTYQEPVTDAGKKTTFINSTSSVTIAADQLKAIVAKVTDIRNMMLA
ncbi:MAG: hypothetical protein H6592_09095 [Flavobacteriales bacterium]|nr:hypothetical protein [Flavobacteriales bacterium]